MAVQSLLRPGLFLLPCESGRLLGLDFLVQRVARIEDPVRGRFALQALRGLREVRKGAVLAEVVPALRLHGNAFAMLPIVAALPAMLGQLLPVALLVAAVVRGVVVVLCSGAAGRLSPGEPLLPTLPLLLLDGLLLLLPLLLEHVARLVVRPIVQELAGIAEAAIARLFVILADAALTCSSDVFDPERGAHVGDPAGRTQLTAVLGIRNGRLAPLRILLVAAEAPVDPLLQCPLLQPLVDLLVPLEDGPRIPADLRVHLQAPHRVARRGVRGRVVGLKARDRRVAVLVGAGGGHVHVALLRGCGDDATLRPRRR
mmetsp:Transcript_39338/g.113863  ORF Transcript_39338/g.113863 Transcript_39338/m.113863 type:complete len:314 (-) Transcript_39338:144-1085(-)